MRMKPPRGEGGGGKTCMVAIANFTACVYAVVWLWRNLART